MDRKRKTFHDKTKFKQFLSTIPALQMALEVKLQSEEVNYTQENTKIDNLETVHQKGGGPTP